MPGDGSQSILRAGIAVFDPGREELRVIGPSPFDIEGLAIRRHVVRELAVQPAQLASWKRAIGIVLTASP
jgi:hypothetical protein